MPQPSISDRIARKLTLTGDDDRAARSSMPAEHRPPSPLRPVLPWLFERGARHRRRLAELPPSSGQLDGVLSQLENEIDMHASLRLPADGNWHDTGMDLQVGESISMLASGRLFVSRLLEVSMGAHAGLWYRIGTAAMQRMTDSAEHITAQQGGRLLVCAALPGAFDSPQGQFDLANPPPKMSSAFDIQLIRWTHTAATAIDKAAQLMPSVFAPLQRSLTNTHTNNGEWEYFWRLGKADIFHQHADDGSLCCDTHGDVGIYQHPVQLPLDEDLQLAWSWNAEALPSNLAEHIQLTHDYLSIAVAFDNGLDLTYMWSAGLPEGTIFQCPLPWWDKRETHWVVRNPGSGLNRWHDEQRMLQDDYKQAIGGPLPKYVTGVWLIANSIFQNGHGRCRYRAIRLTSAQQVINIHA